MFQNFIQELQFYLPIIALVGFGLIRLLLFKTFYDVMLTSVLRGWCANKPCLKLDSEWMLRNWIQIKNQVLIWIQHYQAIGVGFL